jgi:hypothetical protein
VFTPKSVVSPGRSDVPLDHLTVRRRVQLGIPTALPITQHELEQDKYLANAFSSRNDLRFCLLRITPTFHEGRGGAIAEAYVEVKLESQGDAVTAPPKVWSMRPLAVAEKLNFSRNIKGSGGTNASGASVNIDTSFKKHEPFITAYGIQSSSAYWKFSKTHGHEIRGSHTLEMVVCLPKEHNAEALIEIYGITRRRKFGLVPIRGDMGTESCNMTLLADAIEQVPIMREHE